MVNNRGEKYLNATGATVGLVVNYIVCFTLDAFSIPGKPHLLLYGAIGMAACLVVAPIVSRTTTYLCLRRKHKPTTIHHLPTTKP